MNLVRFIDFLRDRLSLVIKACLGLLALLVVADIARVFLSHGHEAASEHAAPAAHGAEAAHGFWAQLYHIAETWPAFWSVFGFIACVLIVYISKWYGHLKVGRTEIMAKEDFYNE
ncbi:MAG: hypothetical protein QM715_08860 [Nibricoccus sp.]